MLIDYASPSLTDNDIAYFQAVIGELAACETLSKGELPFRTPSGHAVNYSIACNHYGRIVTFTEKQSHAEYLARLKPNCLALASGAY